MRNLIAIALFCTTIVSATSSFTELIPVDNEKKEKVDKKNEEEKNKANNKNLHSVKKWKITIEYTNGNIISKTIVVRKKSELSALETAFSEAEKYIKDIKKVKDFYVSPIPGSYVLLAGD
ncbi:hypothetical protein ABW636_05880 [Aquimarina sp. 2201CG1-2-11]|uniref:hypothetical protein n=1 Tax=Aquimarina discodermiae TaxID=3231043 RepID=UPI0034620A6A